MLRRVLLLTSLLGSSLLTVTASESECPGYKASNVQKAANSLTADLTLAGKPCDRYGTDLVNLKLLVEYQTGMALFHGINPLAVSPTGTLS